MRLERFNIDPVRIEQGAIAFDNADDPRAIFFAQEFGGVIADIAEPLNDDALAIQRAKTGRLSRHLHDGKTRASILNAAACGLGASGDAARIQRLACHTGAGIDIGRIHAAILIGNPGHFARAGPHVRSRYILRRIDQVALDQLMDQNGA